jgi:ABC-2 type transport system ATP-binding protein
MMKRMALARTLLIDPRVFLLDEPTSGLDPSGQRKLQNIILSMNKKDRAILISSHNLYEVERISDQIFFLKDGKLTTIDSVSEAFDDDEGPIIIDMTLNNLEDTLIDSIINEFQGTNLVSKGKRKVRLSAERTIDKDKFIAYVKEKGGDIVEIKYL